MPEWRHLSGDHPEPTFDDLLPRPRRRHATTTPGRTPMLTQLADRLFWKDLAERALGQAFQVLLPFLLIVATTSRIDLKAGAAVAVIALVQAAVVVLRAIAGVRASDTAPQAVQILDRAAAAAAAALVSILTAEGFDLLHANARAIALSVVSTVAVALGHRYLTLPTDTRTA